MIKEQIGERIILRLISREDTKLIVAWRNNARVRKNFIFQEQFTEEMHNHWLDTKVASGEVVQFIITIKKDGVPIGSVYFRNIDYDEKKAEYGIFIGEDTAVGKGYGTEAAELALEYAFHVLELKKVYLRVFADNKSAIQSYLNAGFGKIDYTENIVTPSGGYRKVIFMEKNIE